MKQTYRTTHRNIESCRAKFRRISYTVQNEKDIQRFLNIPENNSVTGCTELTGNNSVTFQTGHD